MSHSDEENLVKGVDGESVPVSDTSNVTEQNSEKNSGENVSESTSSSDTSASAAVDEEQVVVVPKRKLSSANEQDIEVKFSRTEETDPTTVSEALEKSTTEKSNGSGDAAADATAEVGSTTTEHPGDNSEGNEQPVLLTNATAVVIPLDADPSIGLMKTSATTSNETGLRTEIWEINPEKVGAIIGTKGAIIQEIQTRSTCKVLVDQNMPPGVNRVVTMIGTSDQVKSAGEIIKLILAHGPTAIHINTQTGGQLMSTEMECPQPLVGRIIGGGGATIRELQARSGAKIQIDQNFPDGVPRKVEITGTSEAIKIASDLIKYVLDNGPNLPPLAAGQGSLPGAVGGISGAMAAAMGPGGTMSIEVPKMHVGKIIGRGGEIVNMIQQKAGCSKVQIDQNVPEGAPCKVLITGNGPNQQYAVHLIQEIMQGGAQRIHSLPPIGGGGGMYGNTGMPAMYGGLQGMYGGGGGMYGGGNPYGGYGAGVPGMMQGAGGYGGGMYGSGMSAYGPGQVQTGGVPGYGGQQQAAQKPPSPWTEHKTDEGHQYWYNSSTGVSTWERPAGI